MNTYVYHLISRYCISYLSKCISYFRGSKFFLLYIKYRSVLKSIVNFDIYSVSGTDQVFSNPVLIESHHDPFFTSASPGSLFQSEN